MAPSFVYAVFFYKLASSLATPSMIASGLTEQPGI